MTITLPTEPLYSNSAGQKIYWINECAKGTRTPADLRLLVAHHTGGTDSRLYLARNALKSSSTYLVGKYPDCGLRIYKYMSEGNAAPYTQGYGSISTLDTALEINKSAISIEMEGPPIDPDVLDASAKLTASILRYWDEQGRDLLLIGHKHLDARKKDPDWNWNDFCKRVYGYL